MSKEDTVEKLKAQGFSANLESGVVMVTVRSQREWDGAKRAVKDIGLNGSWGLLWDKRGEQAENDNSRG